MRRCLWIVVGFAVGLVGSPGSLHAGSPASEALLAWWGDMRSIEYPATERDPAVLEQARDQLTRFRTENPGAVLLDVGGMLGPICTSESPYDLPPLPFYAKIRVAGVNLSEGDWIAMSPVYMYNTLKAADSVALLSTGRSFGDTRPPAIQPATVSKAGDRTYLLAGATRLDPQPFSVDLPGRVQTGADPEPILREALTPLREKNPNATCVLMADLPRDEAISLAQRMPRVDLLLLNEPLDLLQPKQVGESLWVVGRPEAGRMGVARAKCDDRGRIQTLAVEVRDLLPGVQPKGNLWTALGLASRPPARRTLAKDTPKPIIGINLVDPGAIVRSIGYANSAVESVRCSGMPETFRGQVANKEILSFRVLSEGKEIGRLYRVHLLLPGANGDFILNVVFDGEGRIARATTKVEPVIGMQYVVLSKVLTEWEGRKPSEISITARAYPGIDQHLAILKRVLELAAEIDKECR